MEKPSEPRLSYNYEADPNASGLRAVNEGEERQHEKKSVLKKIKDKAKKIKTTLAKSTHGLEVEDSDHDDDEELNDPGVHGASMNESAAAGNLGGDDEMLRNSRDNESIAARRFLHQDGSSDLPRVANLGTTTTLEEDHNANASKDGKDAFSPSNYQTKVTDPIASGGAEAAIEPLVHRFQSVKVIEESQPSMPDSTTSATSAGAGEADPTATSAPPVGHDKGMSVRELVAEKLRPGEEDRALSEVISNAIRSRQEKKTREEVDVSDPLEEDVSEIPPPPPPPSSAKASYSGKGVVERIKGAVGSLFGKGGDHSRDSPGN